MLSSLGLANRLHNLPAEMSAGEQQRVAVGRALITNPSIILADEPVADVDPATAEEILSLILKSASATGAAVILATHGAPPEGFTKRILTLKDGVLV
jgi:ABC-type lipoprotein export system ATPase subunit